MSGGPYSKDNSISFPSFTQGRQYYSKDAPPAWTRYSRIVTIDRRLDGERLDNWQTVIENGGNATTNMTARFCSSETHGSGYAKCTYTSDLYNFTLIRENEGFPMDQSNWGQIDPVAPSVDLGFCDNLARAAFYKKLHLVERQFQGYVFLGELTETLHMLKHPTQTLHKLSKDFLDTLRKRKRANPMGWLNDLGGLWLEQAFGWQPLLNDIRDAIKAYDRFTEPTQKVKISAGAGKAYDLSSSLSGFGKPGATSQSALGCFWRNVFHVLREDHLVRYRAALRAQVECPRWGDYSLFGFNPKEFVPAAWELLPWSFLIDYFTNIGDILDASITSTRDLLYVNKSTIRQTYNRFVIVHEPHLGDQPANHWVAHSWTNNRVDSMKKRRDVARTKNAGYSIPTLQFNFSLSDGQLGNCAALLAQANSLHPQDQPRKWHR